MMDMISLLVRLTSLSREDIDNMPLHETTAIIKKIVPKQEK